MIKFYIEKCGKNSWAIFWEKTTVNLLNETVVLRSWIDTYKTKKEALQALSALEA